MTLGCSDIDAGVRSLGNIGYHVQFIDRNLPNDVAKVKFLSAPWTVHAIAYTRANSGLPIELVSYDVHQPEEPGRFTGIFAGVERDRQGAPNGNYRDILQPVVAACGPAEIGSLPGFGVPAVFKNGAHGRGALVAAVLAVENLSKAKEFWCSAVGFRAGAYSMENADWQRLEFVSPVSAWCFTLVLVTSRRLSLPAFLDARGMACLAFVCTDICRDRADLLACGAEGAGIFNARVNGRELLVEMLRSPDGAYLELLQFA
ncbi:MAG TPA: hypothetical protein VFB29_00865 [Pseudolabrys sp.]|nr:hypothetical protein [Pseudolabrys sp.]